MSQRLTTAPRRSTRLTRAGLAVLAGVALGLSWQPYGLWPLLLIGIPAFTLIVLTPGGSSGPAPPRRRLAAFSSVEIRPGIPPSSALPSIHLDDAGPSTNLRAQALVREQRPRRAFGLGYLFGLAMLTVTISWVHVLGVWVAALLILFEALFFGVLGVALTLVTRLRWWPLAAACCWVLVEFAYARVPFGGFGWTRIAYAAVDTPVAGFFPVIGVAGVSFVVALIGQLLAWVALSAWTHRRLGRRLVAAAVSVAVLLGAGGALTQFQVEPLATGASVNVGIVQGNIPGRGIEAMGRARSVTNNHLSQTVDLLTRARLGQTPRPDFLLWPENSTDIDPTLDVVTQGTVQAATQLAGVPILVGAVMQGPGPDERQTTALWWEGAAGITARYDKRNLVPFGEWIPFRRQLLPIVPILAEVGAQSVPGTRPGVLDVTVAGRPLKVGDVICFELAYDRTVYDAVRGGAQVMMVQSNNATYGGTGQIEQQFSITRARAMETRREIAVATTNSVSGYIDRNGHVVHRTDEFTAAGLVVTMPERSALTPALTVAPWFERGLALAAALCCAYAAWRRRPGPTLRNTGHAQLERSANDDERDEQTEMVR